RPDYCVAMKPQVSHVGKTGFFELGQCSSATAALSFPATPVELRHSETGPGRSFGGLGTINAPGSDDPLDGLSRVLRFARTSRLQSDRRPEAAVGSSCAAALRRYPAG